MTIADAQREMRARFASGVAGQLFAGVLWLAADARRHRPEGRGRQLRDGTVLRPDARIEPAATVTGSSRDARG